jgi:hypothetical protein
MKTKNLFVLAAGMLLSFHVSAQFEAGENIVITEKVAHDLYVTGGTVTINAPVMGDLVVAGGTVIVNDTIYQDILAAGGNINLNGYVGDDIRCAGGKIILSKNVAGDVVATGGTVQINKNVIIAGYLLSAGGEVTLEGEVKGIIKSTSGTFTLNGVANNDIDCRGGKIRINGIVNGHSVLAGNTIEIGPRAELNKDVRYWNKENALDFGNALHQSNATFDESLEIEDGRWHFLGFASILMVLWYLGTALLMIVIIHYLFSLTMKNAANTVKNASIKSLGMGFLFLIGLPILIVVCMITIIGIPVGVLMLVGYLTVVLLGTVIVSLLAANWINETQYNSLWSGRRIVFVAFGIFIFLKLASLTPLIGPLIMLLLVCMAFGGILQNITWRRRKGLELT